MAFRSSNPTLKDNAFENLASADGTQQMTIEGTVNKTGILLLLVIASAAMVWSKAMPILAQNIMPTWLMPTMIGGALGGFGMAMVVIFNKKSAGVTAPIYAVVEGLFLGAVSAMYASQYEGIVLQAVMLTFGVFISLLMLYKAKIIRATEKFKTGIMAATGGIMMVYIVSMVMGFFNGGVGIGVLSAATPMGIGISLVIVTIAALNLIMDFDFIEKASEAGAPKYMEWYGAFGLMVTLVWLYLEILRLLSKLNRRE